MDVITIIWYFSTFLLLILFFVVMVCSDNVCNRRRRSKPEDVPVESPPTPAPSYREFAPPGYDTVMKKYKTNRISLVDQPGLFSQMEPPPPGSPISILSELFDYPVVTRVSVNASSAPNDSGLGLVELRVIASSAQSSIVTVETPQQSREMAVISEERIDLEHLRNSSVQSIIANELPTPKSPENTRSLSG